MRSDGSHERMLTRPRGPYSNAPSFSPNGKKIAYAHPVGGGLELFLVEPDGRNNKQLTKEGGVELVRLVVEGREDAVGRGAGVAGAQGVARAKGFASPPCRRLNCQINSV